jgi:transcriptional regulator with XRE-family HTH domain
VTTPTPTSVRRQLGIELRRLRGRRRGAEVSTALGWSESKLSRIETARTGISIEDLDLLLAGYGVAEDERARLRDLARRTRQRAWWHPYRAAVPDPYGDYVALEAEAVSMDEWESQVVPGLLQSDEYAREVIGAGTDLSGPDVVQQRVRLRMARQSVLTRDPSPRLSIVLDEAVVRREVGGRAVLRRQVQRLFDASHRDDVQLQVLPFGAGVHGALAGSFTIFGFGAGGRPPVVHSEGITGGLFRSKSSEVQVYATAFADLRRRALDVDRSRAFLAQIGAELDEGFLR